MNTLREEQQFSDPYPWLREDDKRRNLTDKEILEKYVDLDTSCLSQKEKEELIDILYKEAFILRDHIGTCPNIEEDIDVIDKPPFFIRLYHIKEEDKQVLDREMKRLCHLAY